MIRLTFGGSETAIKDGDDAQRALRSMAPLDTLDAVRNDRVVTINFSHLVGGPLAVDGLETIVRGVERSG